MRIAAEPARDLGFVIEDSVHPEKIVILNERSRPSGE